MNMPIKLYALLFAALLLAAPVAASQQNCARDAAEIIYPAPQNACLGAVAALPSSLGLAAHTDALTPKALARTRDVFAAARVSLTPAASGAQLLFESSPVTRAGAFRDEGYQIDIPAAGTPITVRANSETGFLYAALTLGRLLRTDADGKPAIYTGSVDDFPAFAFRGVLEGGYDVWQFENRADILRWMGPLKMNYFIYAPKEDPLFRRQWRKPFPQQILDEYRKYLALCDEYNIIFAFSLSPALNMEYSSDEEFHALLAKYRQIQNLGVKHFGIFFDDVLPFLSTPADQARFEHIAEAEAFVTNKLLEFLRKNDPEARLFFVPNQYWGWTPTRYWEIIRRDLNPDIEIGWTGIDIVSDEITVKHAEKFKETVGRYPAIGDNYSPMYALDRREPGLYKVASSFVNNPYAYAADSKAQLSKFVDATVGDYAWNPEGYDPDRSLRMDARHEAGGSAIAGEALLLALRLDGARRIKSAWHKELQDLVDKLAKTAPRDTGKIAKALDKRLLAMQSRIRAIKDSGINPLLLAQLENKLQKADGMLTQARDTLAAGAARNKPAELAAAIQKNLAM